MSHETTEHAGPLILSSRTDSRTQLPYVLIDRTTRWGNPLLLGRDGGREEIIRRFEAEILPRLDVEPLRGKNLLCHCWPLSCHAEAIFRKLGQLVPPRPPAPTDPQGDLLR